VLGTAGVDVVVAAWLVETAVLLTTDAGFDAEIAAVLDPIVGPTPVELPPQLGWPLTVEQVCPAGQQKFLFLQAT